MAELDGDGVPEPAEHSARDVALDKPPQDVGRVTRSAAARIVLLAAQTGGLGNHRGRDGRRGLWLTHTSAMTAGPVGGPCASPAPADPSSAASIASSTVR